MSNPEERSRFLRFAAVGAIGAVVDFSVFNLLVNIFRIPTVSASVISFIAAVMSNFLWNRFWTYPDSRSKKIPRQIAQFSLVSVIGLGIRTPLFAWLEKILIRQFATFLPKNFFFNSTFVGHNIALAIAILVVMLWNFYANRLWTYNDVE